MKCVANYEVESDTSVVSDEIRLKLQDPKGRFQARIGNIVRVDYSTPFLLSVHITFEVPNLQEAKEIAELRLAECLNMLAFATGASVKRHRIRQIVDCTPESGMRECLVWTDSFGHDDPHPFLDERIIASMERLLETDPPRPIRRALRWYRLGAYSWVPEDQFQYLWFALEILAEHAKEPEKVPDRCPECKSPLYCETCKTHPTHRPYPKQAIYALIRSVDACDEQTIETLDKARNALMHGATLVEIEEKLPKPKESIVDVLGKILFKALLHQFPKELFNGKLHVGTPSTYIHRTLTGIAHMSTAVPKHADGELDLSFTGFKAEIVTDGPPESGLPSVIEMTPDQHKRLEALLREKGDHVDMCGRILKRTGQVPDGKVGALVRATDLARIKAALKGGERGDWQNLFREILEAKPPVMVRVQ